MIHPTGLAVLLSGRGSNFLAIHAAVEQGRIPVPIHVVIANRGDAPGLARARELGVHEVVIEHRQFADRTAHEREVVRAIREAGGDLVVLAGYMRLLSPYFIHQFPERIVNIHPSLLPAFPGVDAQAQAINHGVKISGCTVHLVDEHLDAGPIVVQRAVGVYDDDSEEKLAVRILTEEHEAYVEALRSLCGGYRVEGRRVIFSDKRDPSPRGLRGKD